MIESPSRHGSGELQAKDGENGEPSVAKALMSGCRLAARLEAVPFQTQLAMSEPDDLRRTRLRFCHLFRLHQLIKFFFR